MPSVLPTQRCIYLMASGIPIALLIAWLMPWAWMLSFAIITAVFVLFILDALAARSSSSFELQPYAPPVWFVGENNPFRLTVEDTSGRYLPDMTVQFEFNEIVAVADSEKLPADGVLNLDLSMERRGEARLDAIWLRWTGPFGLAAKQLRLAGELHRPVNPDIRTLQSDAVRFLTREADFGIKSQQDRGDGSEFDAMREFVVGMDRRAVDWKASARHMSLMAKEFRTERNHNVVLA
ncbi:MAG: DUF58 domain-containing protein, partial [Ponticaulis sp.]|nr:DUF58 domain-containing protein [Ponticaulis sp.]